MAILKLPFFSKQPEVKPWSFPDEKYELITDYLYRREVNLNSLNIPRNHSRYISSKIPQLIQESEINMENHDKIFSSHWISYDEIVIGTKCNKLLILNIKNNKRFEIPLVTEEDRINNHNNSNSNSSLINNIISTISHSNNNDNDNDNDDGDDNNIITNTTTTTTTTINNNQDNGNCSGIRSIAVNPSKTLLAVGAGKPYQVTIYELPSFDPIAVFAGHNDLVFSVAWLDDDHVVSGSRDGTIRLWSTQSKIVSELPILPNNYINIHQSLLSRSGHIGKVRDLKYNPKTEQIMTLSTAGYVKIWDSSYLNRIAKIQLTHTNENVCLSMNSKLNLYAVGSQAHVSILDPKISPSIVHEIDSVDKGWGVRSLNFNDHIVTIGGGYGRLSFYDLRAQKYLEFCSINVNKDLNIYQQSYYDDDNNYSVNAYNYNNNIPAATANNISDNSNNSDNNNSSNDHHNHHYHNFSNENSVVCNYREIGSGWLNRDVVYVNHFSGSSIQNAIYTLSYDESGTKLFSGGGPLHLGLKGSYAALWS